MPRITIDGKTLQVPEGTTLLDAARTFGIDIPTLCFAPGKPPGTSCYVCVVQVEGRPGLDPACGTVATEGMIVTSQSPQITSARRTALELLLSEHHGDCEGPCVLACPASLDIPRMLEHLARGRTDEALRSAREKILFNAALGRVCPGFCERACRRADMDEPVAIAALQRVVGDAGVAEDALDSAPLQYQAATSAAIVGAGPAGLTAAYYLLKQGHACTIFDANPKPGGFFRYGIPEFRLPDKTLDGEIDAVRRLGAEFRMSVRIGSDITLDALREQFDAVIVATGATRCVYPDGLDATLLTSALDFLRSAHDDSQGIDGPVVVLGASDMAVDAARTATHLGARPVTLVCSNQRSQMSVPSIRSHEAESEGVVLLRKSEPKSLVRRANGLLRLTLVDGRVLDARFVVAAIDREVEVDALAAMNLPVAKKGIQADHRTGATGIPGVFAAGESVLGPSYGVRAVASAREVAMIVDRYLRGESISPLPPRINCRMGRLTEDELAIIRDAASRAPRLKPEHVGSQSIGEARRCLQCGCSTRDDCALRDIASSFSANPSRFKGPRRAFARDESHEDVVYEPNKCILCGLCIQAAAEKGEQLGLTFIDRGFAATTAVPFGRMLADGLKSAGDACVSLCPTGALSFKLGPRRGRT